MHTMTTDQHLRSLHIRRAAVYRSVQLVTAVPFNVLLMVTLDDPGGPLGARNAWTMPALYVVLTFAVLGLAAYIGMRLRRRWGFILCAVAFGSLAPVYAFALQADTLIAGLGCAFNLGLSFAVACWQARLRRQTDVPREHKPSAWIPSLLWLNGLALLVSLIVAGYRIVSLPDAVGAAFVLVFGTLAASIVFELRHMSPHWRRGPHIEWVLLGTIVVAAALGADTRVLIGLGALRQAVVLVRLVARTDVAARLSRYFFRRPAQLLATSFITVILLGTLALSFPYVAADGTPLRPVDAFFTATSATCVTGLIVLDTATDFSLFGQFIILGLIQIGGLGIMTISTFAAIMIGRDIGLGQEYSLTRMIGEASVSRVYRLVRFICIGTFCVEAVGAVILFPQFRAAGLGAFNAAWRALFHSISGFCNAGFALQTDSLAGFQGMPGIVVTMSLLIILGGLGFGVLYWLWERGTGAKATCGAHVRMVFWGSALLLVGMTVVVLLIEWRHALAGLGARDAFINAWFCAVTPRTAGFNTITMDALQPATRCVTMAMMFIGVAPGSTGGGVKVTTIIVLLLTVRALVRGDREVQGFGFSLATDTVFRAAAVVMLGALAVVLGLTVLLATQALPFETLLFETVSAFGTVGLSLGATPRLTDVGRLAIILLMFVGRVGPLTLVLSLRPLRKQMLFYPRAPVMIG
jgi:trk system potassium uptake protein TrkH